MQRTDSGALHIFGDRQFRKGMAHIMIDDIGYLIKMTADRIQRMGDADFGQYNLTFTQSRVLVFLARHKGRSTQKEIRDSLQVSNPTMIGIISRLKKNGFVETFRDENDRRKTIVCMTDRAAQVNEKLERSQKMLTASLTDEESRQLADILHKILNYTDSSSKIKSEVLKKNHLFREEELYIPVEEGRIFTKIRIPSRMTGEEKYPVVIFSHGLGANHDSSLRMQTAMADAGILVASFDFRGGCGLPGFPGLSTGSMLDMSVCTEEEDLSAVIEYIRKMPEADTSRFCLSGESQGGFVSTMYAVKHPDEIRALFLLFPAFNLPDYIRSVQKEEKPSEDETTMLFGMKCGRRAVEDALKIDPARDLTGFPGPVVIWHGDEDSVVDLSVSVKMQKLFPDCELNVIHGQSHLFTGKTCENIGKNIAGRITDRFAAGHDVDQ